MKLRFAISARSPRKETRRSLAATVRSSRLLAAILLLIASFHLPSFGAQMCFGPYTNYDGTLITNTTVIVRAVGDPAIDAAGNVTGAIGLPIRIPLGPDGRFTNTLQNQNYFVTNALGGPAYFNRGYCFRAPLDSGPTVYATTAPGILITGMNYFITLNGGTNGASVTYNQITNGLGYTPLSLAGTNGYLRLNDISTNYDGLGAALVIGAAGTNYTMGASNALYSDYTTKLALKAALSQVTNIVQSATNGFSPLVFTNISQVLYTNALPELTNNFVDKSITNNAATRAELISATNGIAGSVGISAGTATNINNAAGGVIATNGAALTYKFSAAGTNAVLSIAGPLTNGYVDAAITNNAATRAELISATNGIAGSVGISAGTATNINNAVGGVIATNGAALTYKFSASGTNAVLSIAGPLTNGYVDASITNNAATRAEMQAADALRVATNSGSSWNQNAYNLNATMTSNSVVPMDSLSSVGVDTSGLAGNGMLVGQKAGDLNWRQTIFNNEENSLGQGYILYGGAYGGADFSLSVNSFFNALDGAYVGGNYNQATNSFQVSEMGSFNGANFANSTNNQAWAERGSFSGVNFANAKNCLIFVEDGIAHFNLSGRSNISIFLDKSSILAGNPPSGYNQRFTNSIGIIDSGGFFSGLSNGFVLGSLSSATNLPVSGISTNGSTANQVVTSIGGNAVWTNVTSILPAGITNAYGTNLATVLVTGQRVYIPTNDPSIASNWFQSSKVSSTNGFATGLTASNTALQGNVSMGRDGASTVFIGGTNFVAFNGAGSGIVTNGAFVWVGALYTNFLNGATLTNNGSQWLAVSNGVSLYSLSGASPVGTYSAVSGVAPNPTAVYTEAANDHLVQLGYWSKTNQDQLFANATNGVIAQTTNNFIANNQGYGTNTYLTNAVFEWSSPGSSTFVRFQYMNAGYSNTLTGSGFGAAILSGQSNNLVNDGSGVIAGGQYNNISGSIQNYCSILGGYSNSISGSESYATIGGGSYNRVTTSGDWGFIGGGQGNLIEGGGSFGDKHASILGGAYNTITINGVFREGSTILGGQSNIVAGNYSTAAGRNVGISNSSVFAWSDGMPLNSITNAQFMIQATNGLYLNGPLWLGAANTNNGVYYLSNAPFSLYAVTNAMPNFAHWQGNSNGIMVDIFYSNGVPYMKNNWP